MIDSHLKKAKMSPYEPAKPKPITQIPPNALVNGGASGGLYDPRCGTNQLAANRVSEDFEIWPCTVVRDLHKGKYSGGRWIAIHCEPHHVSWEISGDGQYEWWCEDFWKRVRENDNLIAGRPVVVGDSPLEVLRKLKFRVESLQ